MHSVGSSSHLTPSRRHYEFIAAEDSDPLELRALMTPPRHLSEEQNEYHCSFDECSEDSQGDYASDDLSTSAQPGGGINDDPPQKLIHTPDCSRRSEVEPQQIGRSKLKDQSEDSPSLTDPRLAFIEPDEPATPGSSTHFLARDANTIMEATGQPPYQMSPCASTETTISCCTSSSHNYYYTEEDGMHMSWEEWNELIASQLAPWCDLLLASREDDGGLIDLVKDQMKEDFEHQNQVQTATGLAFLHGLALQQKRHAAKLQELEEQQQQQLAMLQHSVAVDASLFSIPQHSVQFQCGTQGTKRSDALRRKWKATSSGVSVAGTDVNDCDNHTVASVWSTMSCRELSIERYRRARKMRPKTRSSTSNNANTTTQASEQQNNEEVQRLLEELQLAEKRQKRLEQQLKQAGVVLAEDIPYQEAKDQVERISKRMNEIGSSEGNAEYFRLEQDMEKYMNALLLTDEYITEQQAIEDAWEHTHEADNKLALQQVRRHMPVEIRKLTRQQLLDLDISPAMVKKFQRTNVLQLLRQDPEQSIARWHPSNLESLRISGLTLKERRALHAHLQPSARVWATRKDPLTERKRTWFQTMRLNFKESLAKCERHLKATDGHSGTCHECSLIGRQCPVRANLAMDYSGIGLGFPEGDVYEDSLLVASSSPDGDDTQTDATAQRCSGERLQGLRKHYKGSPNKVQQVSLAVGVCEAMEALMDRLDHQQEEWILEQFQSSASNSLQDQDLALTAKLLNDLKQDLSSWTMRSQADDDSSHDPRSFLEVGLIEEVYEAASDYIAELKKRLLLLGDDGNPNGRRLAMMMDQLEPLLEMSHTGNLLALSQAPIKPLKTRQRRSRTEIMASLWKKDCSAASCSKSASNAPIQQASELSDRAAGTPQSIRRTRTTKKKQTSVQKDKKGRNALVDQIKRKRHGKGKDNQKAPVGLLDAISARQAHV